MVKSNLKSNINYPEIKKLNEEDRNRKYHYMKLNCLT